MNGSMMMIFVIVAAGVLAAAAITFGRKNRNGQVKELQVDAVEKKRKNEPVREKPEVTAAKKELYRYLNQVVKKMFQYYRRDNWDKLTRVGMPPEEVQKYYPTIKETLPAKAVELLDAYESCIDWKGDEEHAPGRIVEQEKLKETFLNMVLPFYPVYYRELDGIRYTSLLNQTMHNLFHRLTGRKFRMGYKNRYENGVSAYRWEGERFQVYREDGTMLCDAVFRQGKVWEGYAVLPVETEGAFTVKDGEGVKEQEKDWHLVQKGVFHEGVFQDGTLHYNYQKKER